jgi:antitoxin component of MazEF toxin-antitoxin module
MPKSTRLTNVLRTGNSYAVVIPAKFARQIGIKSGDKVKVEANPKTGMVTYTFIDVRQLSLV